MALIVLAHNGIGLGHLSRALVLCRALASRGPRPIVFAQGSFPEWLRREFAGQRVPALWRASSQQRQRVLAGLSAAASLSSPGVVFEDTHPVGESLAPGVERVLVVRPTKFEYLRDLRADHSDIYRSFWIADAPDSPTWIYTPEQTGEILSWSNVRIVGPMYRRPTESEIADVRNRYRLRPDERMCVFTMGGGGDHDGACDSLQFRHQAARVAAGIRQVDPGARMIFVCGPYFTGSIQDLEEFEVVREEPAMPALIACAHGVVARPGFNTVWECLSAGALLYCVPGTAWNEPIDERVSRLQDLGLAVRDLCDSWLDETRIERVREAAGEVVAVFPGHPQRCLSDLLPPSAHRQTTMDQRPKRALVVAINGVGIGHIIRSRTLARRLRRRGWDVVVVVETNDAPKWLQETERVVPRLNRDNTDDYLRAWETLIAEFEPDTIVFDTHVPPPRALLRQILFAPTFMLSSMPSKALLNSLLDDRVTVGVKVLLLHSFEEFQMMYGADSAARVADSTRAALVGGPLLSLAEDHDGPVAQLPTQPFLLIILGGGGEHPRLTEMRSVADLINSLGRHAAKYHGLSTIAVCGPLFVHRDMLDDNLMFVHDFVANVAHLAAAARVVVARPGFNLTRELFAVDGALVFLKTGQFSEATDENLAMIRTLRQSEVAELTPESACAALDRALAEGGRRAVPLWADSVQEVLRQIDEPDDALIWHALSGLLRDLPSRCKRLVIRVDDVSAIDEPLSWVLSECAKRGVRPSLQVIPYLATLNDEALDQIDPGGELEVCQHGYVHLNTSRPETTKSEFSLSAEPRAEDVEALRLGLEIMKERFDKRFHGGMSPPFDGCPPWLPSVWGSAGGRYISTIWARATGCIPVVGAGVEIWDWTRGALRPTWRVAREMVRSSWERGYIVVVVHPGVLTAAQRAWFCAMLDACVAGGAEPVTIRALAGSSATQAFQQASRSYSGSRRGLRS